MRGGWLILSYCNPDHASVHVHRQVAHAYSPANELGGDCSST